MSANPDISANRLGLEDYLAGFCDIHGSLDLKRAKIESARCYYCYDAPCISACPTGINIPGFIKKIATGNTQGAAVEILSENILGGTCARVCPVEVLCQHACVRNQAEDKPVEIGLLQKFATDTLFQSNVQPFKRLADTGKRIAIIGAGPAGLSAAHRLALLGHQVVIFEARSKSGGLNEYGLAAYKMVDNFAAREIQFILKTGGIEVRHEQILGRTIELEHLQKEYDAVFLGIGLQSVKSLEIPGEELPGVWNAVDFIEKIRQAQAANSLASLPVGRRVVVIGGGNTAIDISVQVKRLGAEFVTLLYRRGFKEMSATQEEREFALKNGVVLRTWAKPVRILGSSQGVSAVEFISSKDSKSVFTVEADMVFKAIGQTLLSTQPSEEESFPLGSKGKAPQIEGRKILVDQNRKTSLPKVYAGGDCTQMGSDLTVDAVQDGKVAALAIHQQLMTPTDDKDSSRKGRI